MECDNRGRPAYIYISPLCSPSPALRLHQRQPIMAIVENVEEDSAGSGPGPSTTAELLSRIKSLTDQLALPEDLLPTFMAEDKRQSHARCEQ